MKHQTRKRLLLFIGAPLLALFLFDYLHTRSAAYFALRLARFGPGTTLADYQREFGPPNVHQTDPFQIQQWGPTTDPDLLQRTELYFFSHPGLPYCHVVVYLDKTTQKSAYVTWKGM